jgi:hypothetical protein
MNAGPQTAASCRSEKCHSSSSIVAQQFSEDRSSTSTPRTPARRPHSGLSNAVSTSCAARGLRVRAMYRRRSGASAGGLVRGTRVGRGYRSHKAAGQAIGAPRAVSGCRARFVVSFVFARRAGRSCSRAASLAAWPGSASTRKPLASTSAPTPNGYSASEQARHSTGTVTVACLLVRSSGCCLTIKIGYRRRGHPCLGRGY